MGAAHTPDEADDLVLSLRDVRKVYASGEAEVAALDGVSLDVRRGEFVAIVGTSGSGKSTLMNMIGCLDRPTSGTYHLVGHDVSAFDDTQRAEARSRYVGFIFQGFNLLARTSAVENVETPLLYLGVGHEERRARALRALDLVGLSGRVNNTPSQLSGGQQQRVAIARALVTNPALLLADEPTGNLDSRTTEEVLALLQWLNRERGVTLVMVTHEPDVAACASRVVTVRDGRIVSDVRNASPRRAGQRSEVDDATAEDALATLSAPLPEARAGMGWTMALTLAARSLLRSKLRAALTALGILIGIAAVVTMSAVGEGAKARVRTQMSALGANLLVVMPGGGMAGGARGAAGSVTSLTDDDAEAIAREVPTVSHVAPVLAANAQVVAGDQNASTRVTGTTPRYFAVRAWAASRGTLWDDDAVRAAQPVCAIGETVRKALFENVDAVGREMRVGRMTCTVVATLAPKGQSGFGQDNDDAVLMPISAFRAGITRLPNGQVNMVMVTARSADVVHRAQFGVTELLRQRHPVRAGEEDAFRVNNLSDIMSTFNEQMSLLSMVLLLVASISLLVGGIGVMNIMLVSVTERTREIGVRLAIGAQADDILTQFLFEAVMLAAVGGVVGLSLGYGAAAILGHVTKLAMTVPPTIAFFSVLVSCGLGVVFGYVPARRAAHLDPIDALRRE